MNILPNITNNITFLQNEFIDASINYLGIGLFFTHVFIASAIFVIFYLFGEKVRKLSFKENKEFLPYINIALGYILIGTGIALLGMLSMLRTEILWGYFLLICILSLVGIKEKIDKARREIRKIRKIRIFRKENSITWGVLLFVLIAFLRLMTPEIGEDGYHTDLPHLYLSSHTMMHEARDPLRVIPYPQLAEMTYIIPIFVGDREAARFIHFGFYFLTILLLFSLSNKKGFSFAKYASLLFATTPLVVKYSPSSFIDFFLLFCFMLSILLLQKGTKKNIILSGLIFGGAIATKLWVLIYIPAIFAYLAYLYRKTRVSIIIWNIGIFFSASIVVGMLWYVRDYLITGSPIYPIFAKPEYLEEINVEQVSLTSNFGFNWRMFMPDNLALLSPLFFLGIFFLALYFKKIYLSVKYIPLATFFILLTMVQLMVSVYLGRHLLVWYSIALIIVSAGIFIAVKMKLFRYLIITVYSIVFSYYFITTLFVLPYGFGWADQNKYLTRVLGRDNANYYDFDRLFNKWISDKDLVATYGIYSYYYADFSYIDVNYIFSKQNRSFDLMKERGATKLLIKGGDIEWFCKILSLTQCNKNKVKLLATWPEAARKYNLYELK